MAPDFLSDLRMLCKVLRRILFTLTDLVALVGVPRSGLVDEALLHTQVDHLPSWKVPLPYMTWNSAWRKGGATLFLTTFTRVSLPTTSSFLDGANATDIQVDGGVKL